MPDHRQRLPISPRRSGQKPVLPMIQLPIYRVKQRHLEAYLASVYRMEGFDFLLAAGATSGMCVEYLVSPTLPPAVTALEEADRIRRGRRTRNIGLILNVLCLDGYIPAGKYIIDTHLEPSPEKVYQGLLQRTGDPTHAECVAFKREHRQNRKFMQVAAEMDKTLLESQPTKQK